MFRLPELPYAYDALGRSISARIMELHHTKHHQTYVDKLNAALEKAPELGEKSVEELIANLDVAPELVRTAIRNHGGGHFNHTLFWQWMSPDGGGQPTRELGDALAAKYGSYQEFVDLFSTQALGVFGSGWAWLMPDLSVATSPNQDNPVMDGRPAPLLGLDVWEHAYYLDYQSGRADYVKAWWDVVNWDFVAERYAARS